MRKILFFMLTAMFAFTSCQKEAIDSQAGKEVPVSLNVQLPDAGFLTRSAPAVPGGHIIHYVLEVYTTAATPTLFVRKAQTTTEFNIRLIAGQTYSFVFWACYIPAASPSDEIETGNPSLHYAYSNLRRITMSTNDLTGYAGNATRDAFFLSQEESVDATGLVKTFTLRRPFAQINVKTIDVAFWGSDALLHPAAVSIKYTSIPTTLNALTGTVGDENPVNYTKTNIISTTSPNADLSMDYVFAASKDTESLINFEMTFYNADGTKISTNADFLNIPIKRNYKTNISGNLLTKAGTLTVVLEDDFYTPGIDFVVQDGMANIGGVDYPSLKDALASITSVSSDKKIVLGKGKYLIPSGTGSTDPLFMNFLTAGVTIEAAPGADVTLYTTEDPSSGNWNAQNFITIQANNVTFKNLKIQANYNTYSSGPNKTIEVVSGVTGFKMENCIIVPGLKTPLNAGSIYIGNDNGIASDAIITDCTFNYAGITVRPGSTLNISGSTFNYGCGHVGWENACLSIRGVATATNNTFNNITPVVANTNAPVNARGIGSITASGNTFPNTTDTYWHNYGTGTISGF